MTVLNCHACGSLPFADRGPFGRLCDDCWVRVIAIVEQIIGKPSRWRTS